MSHEVVEVCEHHLCYGESVGLIVPWLRRRSVEVGKATVALRSDSAALLGTEDVERWLGSHMLATHAPGPTSASSTCVMPGLGHVTCNPSTRESDTGAHWGLLASQPSQSVSSRSVKDPVSKA